MSARAAWSGAAVDLTTQRPEPDRIRALVETLLTTPDYRKRAVELQAEYTRHDPFSEIATVVEEFPRLVSTTVAREGGEEWPR